MTQRRRHRRLSLRRPITIFVFILVLVLTLTVLWHVRLVHDYRKLKDLAAQDAFHWAFIALGSLLFLFIIVLSSVLAAELIGHIRWSRRQSNFLASVSHELNSPLSSIKLFAQTLRQPELEVSDRLDFVNKILFDVERLQRLISNILRSADADSRDDELQVVVQRVDLDTYLREFIRDANRLHASSNLQITFSGDSAMYLELDRLMFRQVLDNLVDNAVRYHGDSAPQVEINVRRVGGWAEISIIDQGVGVSDADLPKLFERFFRARSVATGQRRRHGTGIGLYVVRSIVQAHGGRVRAESTGFGGGLSIILRLPQAPATESDATVTNATESDAAKSSADSEPAPATAPGDLAAPGPATSATTASKVAGA